MLGGDDDGLLAMEDVEVDDRHLEHVLARSVDQRIVGIEVALDDREAPVGLEEGQDLFAGLDRAAIHELAIFAVAQGDVLRLAEGLQRVIAALHLGVCVACAYEVAEANDDQEDSEESEWLLEHFHVMSFRVDVSSS